jgi:predicted dehydrogenase
VGRLSGLRSPHIGRLANADNGGIHEHRISGWLQKRCSRRYITLAFPCRDATPAKNDDMIRAAILGLGRWGRSLVSSVQDNTDDIRFVVGHTRTRAKAEDYCRTKGIRLVDDFEAILSDPDIDAVVLATPHSQHAEQIKQAAAAGKHVLVEKPITLDHASAQVAVEAARQAGIVLAVGYCRRFHPSFGELRQRLQDGRLGMIVGLVAQHTTSTSTFIAPENWRADPDEAPAGAMTAVGLHSLDLMIEFGGHVRDVLCVTARHGDGPSDDTTTVLMRFAGGVTGTIFCSVATATNFSFSAYGSMGLAEVHGAALQHFRFVPISQQAPTGPVLAPPDQIIDYSGFNMLNAELIEFARCIRDKRAYPVGIDDVLHGMAVFDAAVQSAKTGRIVGIPES